MSIGGWYQRLSPREQKMLGVLGLLVGAFVLVGLPIVVYRDIADMHGQNAKMRELLVQINKSQPLLLERKLARDKQLLRYQRPAPPLASFIEKAATENGIEVPESKDRPEVPRGKRYAERITTVTLRKIGLASLVKTLEKLETSGYPIAVTKLNIKKRTGSPDTWDVELAVSAFDRKEEKKDAAGAGSAATSPSSAASGAAESDEGRPL